MTDFNGLTVNFGLEGLTGLKIPRVRVCALEMGSEGLRPP